MGLAGGQRVHLEARGLAGTLAGDVAQAHIPLLPGTADSALNIVEGAIGDGYFNAGANFIEWRR